MEKFFKNFSNLAGFLNFISNIISRGGKKDEKN